ncbi:MAG: hypothetical protein HYV60_10705 [Planctomycetia bacterium]|nr:hypothetical protein [Planctomycetia bacterium]
MSKSDERVAAFIQAASALCDWDPTSADLFVVFPKSVDQQIQAEQNRTLSTRGLTPADDVDMVVTYLPSRLFNRFMVDVVLPAATVPSNQPTRSTSWEPTPIAERLLAR